jgi:hypothetical protein
LKTINPAAIDLFNGRKLKLKIQNVYTHFFDAQHPPKILRHWTN